MGSLNIRSLVHTNRALQGKWLWIFFKEEGRFWRKVIVAKWGRLDFAEEGFHDCRGHGLALWKHIKQDWPRFKECINWKLGRGNCIRFWHDEWLDGGCLKTRFPRIYAIAQSKNMRVEEAYATENGGLSWTVNVSRNLNDWEVFDYEEVLRLVSQCQISGEADLILWKPSKKSEFTVDSLYRQLVGTEQENIPLFTSRQIWNSRGPPRIALLAWEACRGSILTLDKLKTRGQIVINGCFMCKKAEESCCHLVLHCEVVHELWCQIYRLIGINWVISGSVFDEMWAWSGIDLKKNIVKIIPLTFFESFGKKEIRGRLMVLRGILVD